MKMNEESRVCRDRNFFKAVGIPGPRKHSGLKVKKTLTLDEDRSPDSQDSGLRVPANSHSRNDSILSQREPRNFDGYPRAIGAPVSKLFQVTVTHKRRIT